MDLSEFELIGRIAEKTEKGERVETGIGDDAAVIDAGTRIVTTVDTAVGGVHFQLDRPAAESARKAIACAVSDIAAMGLGEGSMDLLVALGAPAETATGYLEELADGVVAAAEEFGADLIGGDVVASPVPFLSVTAIAHVDEQASLVRRSGARTGDVVCVTGPVGGAAAGLLLLQGLEVPDLSELARGLLVECQVRPRPQLTAAPVLARHGATAMIDVSDGLAADLGHIADASGVSIRLKGDDVPLVTGVEQVAAAAGREALDLGLTGGEDYVLALTVAPDRFEAVDSALIEATGFELLAIGAVEAGRDGIPVLLETNRGVVPIAGGHDHFRGPTDGSR